jgi:hypothetical protein
MKTYTEFETEQELRDYLASLCGANTEMEARVGKGEWYPFLSSQVQAMLSCPLLGPFKARVPRALTPQAPAPTTVLNAPHAQLRKQYEEDCLWYNEPWKFWETSVYGQWFEMTAPPSFYRNHSYRRIEPTVTVPDGTVLPRPVDKAKDALYSRVLDCYYRTFEDKIKAEDYFQKMHALIRGAK